MTRVLLDCDGILSDFVGGWLKLLNESFGRSWTHEDITGWDVCSSLGIVDPEERARAKRLIADTPDFAATHDVLPGALEGVAALEKIAEVYIVTSPWNSHRTWTSDRERWLKKHFGIHHDRIVHTGAKHLVYGDVLVDDRTETCAKWRAAFPVGLAIQWRTPHNLRDSWDGHSTNDWNRLLRYVEAA